MAKTVLAHKAQRDQCRVEPLVKVWLEALLASTAWIIAFTECSKYMCACIFMPFEMCVALSVYHIMCLYTYVRSNVFVQHFIWLVLSREVPFASGWSGSADLYWTIEVV